MNVLSRAENKKKDDVCPDDIKRISWPFPVWTILGYGDIGSINGVNDRPPLGTKLTKLTQDMDYERDTAKTNLYRKQNQNVLNNLTGDVRVHHKLPLFLGGADDTANMVFLLHPEHVGWHNQLYYQSWGYMRSDARGTEYCVDSYQ